MADDEEDVVFANSALHQHLQDAGYIEDVDIEHHASNVENFVDGDGDSNAENFRETADGAPGFETSTQYQMPASWWQKESKRVEQECGLTYNKDVLGSGLLEEDDAVFLYNYSQLFSAPHSLSIFSTTAFKISIGVFGVLCAYGVHRWTDSTILPVVAQRFPLWMFDLGVVTLGIISFIPLTSSLLSHILLRRHMNTSLDKLYKLLQQLKELQAICRKVVRFVQEMELVTRGFTLVTSQIPISRLEQSAQRSDRQCPKLRRLIFHSCRELIVQTRATVKLILERCPLRDEDASYLSCIALSDYGPSMTIEDEKQLSEATDNYSIAAIKGIFQVYCLHISELLRRLIVGCILQNQDHKSILKESQDALAVFQSVLSLHLEKLKQSLQLHECTFLEPPEEQILRSKAPCQTQASSVFTAVHSLSLHLQAALKRVKTLEERIEPLTTDQETDIETQLNSLNPDLKVIKADLDSCHDCWDETVLRLDKKQPKPSGGSVNPSSSMSSATRTTEKEPVPLFEMGDPIIQDQVFEAYTDPCEVDPTDYDEEPLLSKSDKEKRRIEKEEAVRLLKELKTVIAVRGKEWDVREERARRAMAGQAEDDMDINGRTGEEVSRTELDVCEDIQKNGLSDTDKVAETTTEGVRSDVSSTAIHMGDVKSIPGTDRLQKACNSAMTVEPLPPSHGLGENPPVNCHVMPDAINPVSSQNAVTMHSPHAHYESHPRFPNLTHTKEDICTISPHIAALTKLCAGIDADQTNGVVPQTSDCTCIVTSSSNGHQNQNFVHSEQCRSRAENDRYQSQPENYSAIGDGGEYLPPDGFGEDNLAALKSKLEEACGLPLGMSSSVAALAAARSQSFGVKCDTIEDTFGDSDTDSNSDDFIDS